jgi:hypothetical protein
VMCGACMMGEDMSQQEFARLFGVVVYIDVDAVV